MTRVGLTGGIGSGKSEVARMLGAHGAVVIDADVLAREAVAPGTPGFASVLAEFGPDVLAADGALDRARLAQVVFADADRRVALEAIVHPYVRWRSAELAAAAPAGAVVVHDVPLLVEQGLQDEYNVVVVVESDVETRVRRLALRGLTEDAAHARIAAQATDDERRTVADVVLVNDADLRHLAGEVARLWDRLGRSV